ncbi:MAG: TPM domain-containing protein, partial [Muribaculaceae bacterium]|nr:TPM domain-containing protein [Muribaculaceae bacterium]
MKKLLILLTAIWITVLSSVAATYTVDEVPNVHVSDRTLYVTNPDGILSAETVSRLDRTLAGVWDSTGAEFVVVALDDISGYDANEFATKLFEHWGIGKKDKDSGLLLLIVEQQHQIVIRTGRGMEGVLPDLICGRIIRNVMTPAFREGDYDRGTIAAVDMMAAAITYPQAAAELRSRYANDRPMRSDESLSLDSMAGFLLKLGGLAALIMLVIVLYTMLSTRSDEPQERWRRLNSLKPVALFLCFFGLGLPLIAYIPLVVAMKRIRSRHRSCPNCGSKMRKLDEEADNAYLTPAQDIEERINSIDYDVWLCPTCGETDIIAYENRSSSYTECPVCHAKACTLASDRIVSQPTPTHTGRGVRTYTCLNCHNNTQKHYDIPKIIVAPIIIGGGDG